MARMKGTNYIGRARKARALAKRRDRIQAKINRLQTQIDLLCIQKSEVHNKIQNLAFGSLPGDHEVRLPL